MKFNLNFLEGSELNLNTFCGGGMSISGNSTIAFPWWVS